MFSPELTRLHMNIVLRVGESIRVPARIIFGNTVTDISPINRYFGIPRIPVVFNKDISRSGILVLSNIVISGSLEFWFQYRNFGIRTSRFCPVTKHLDTGVHIMPNIEILGCVNLIEISAFREFLLCSIKIFRNPKFWFCIQYRNFGISGNLVSFNIEISGFGHPGFVH